jgi:hypothetical protein
MQHFTRIGIAVMVVFIFVSFFLPWVSMESVVTGGIGKLIGKEVKPMAPVSGFKVPILANSSESKMMISLIRLFSPGIQDADKKSYLIWLVPGLSLVIFVAMCFLARNKWVDLVVGVLGVAIFAFGAFKLLATDLDKAVAKVVILPGVWMTLAGYLGIGLICLAGFFVLLGSKR